jgi:hypothetical protein
LFEIFKNYICLSFDEIEFNFVTYVFYNEINNKLLNEYISYFINFIVMLRIYVNLEEFDFLKKNWSLLKGIIKIDWLILNLTNNFKLRWFFYWSTHENLAHLDYMKNNKVFTLTNDDKIFVFIIKCSGQPITSTKIIERTYL